VYEVLNTPWLKIFHVYKIFYAPSLKIFHMCTKYFIHLLWKRIEICHRMSKPVIAFCSGTCRKRASPICPQKIYICIYICYRMCEPVIALFSGTCCKRASPISPPKKRALFLHTIALCIRRGKLEMRVVTHFKIFLKKVYKIFFTPEIFFQYWNALPLISVNRGRNRITYKQE